MVHMCPDPQILSLYHDGELPFPWKKRLESHLSVCADCNERLDQLRHLSGILSESADVSVEPSRERVWQRLHSTGAVAARAWHRPVWSRSVPVPLPLLVAAAALVLAFGVFFVRSPRTAVPAATVLSALDTQTVVPVTDLNRVLQYLATEDSADIMIIRLPESRSFNSHGEPAIIRAADYGGGGASR
jgi:anti-sigma factor RsiW